MPSNKTDAPPAMSGNTDMSDGPRPRPNKPCCCCLRAHVWIDVVSRSIYVENKIEVKRHFETKSAAKVAPNITVAANADVLERVTATASANTGSPPMSAGDSVGAAKSDSNSDSNTKVDADSDGSTLVDEYVFKNQGKIYRTDEYTIRWEAESDGDVDVTLDLSGAATLHAEALPKRGALTTTRNHLLEPANYQPMDALVLSAVLEVVDCCNQLVRAEAQSPRAT